MLDNLKKSIVTYTRKVKTVDPELEAVLEQYKHLCTAVGKVTSELQTFKIHSTAVLECNSRAWGHIDSVGGAENSTSKRVATHKAVADRQKQSFEESSTAISARLGQLATMFTGLDKQVVDRMAALREFEYYQDKLAELEKIATKTPKDESNIKQTQEQLEQSRNRYQELHTRLKSQLLKLTSRRGDIMAYLAQDIATVKQGWLTSLVSSLGSGPIEGAAGNSAASTPHSTTSATAAASNGAAATVKEEKKTKTRKPAPPSSPATAPTTAPTTTTPPTTTNTPPTTIEPAPVEPPQVFTPAVESPPPAAEEPPKEEAPPPEVREAPVAEPPKGSGGPPTKLPPPPVGLPTKPPPPPVA